MPDISAFHLLADQDRVFDGIGGGAACAVTGRRADNRKFTERTDMFANEYDLSWETTWDLYDQLARCTSTTSRTSRSTRSRRAR